MELYKNLGLDVAICLLRALSPYTKCRFLLSIINPEGNPLVCIYTRARVTQLWPQVVSGFETDDWKYLCDKGMK